MNPLPILNSTVHNFDARGVAKRFRHAAIFGALEALEEGETMRFVNDHDPRPLLNQMAQRYGGRVGVTYLAREPGNVVVDMQILSEAQAAAQGANAPEATAFEGGCGSGGCGCAGSR